MFRTIRARIALLIGGLMLLMLLAFSVFLYFSLQAQLLRAVDDGLRLNADQLLAAVKQSDDNRLAFSRGDAQALRISNEDDLIRLVSTTGAVWEVQGDMSLPVSSKTLQTESELYTLGPSDDHDVDYEDPVRLISVPVIINGAIAGYLQLARSLDLVRETLQRLLILLVTSGPVIVLLAMLGGYWLAGRALAPVERIRRQAATISAKDLSQRLNLHLPDDEVGRLARTFDQMLDRLEESFHRQRRFASDASHELRTPLAIIRGEVDVTLEHPRSPDDYIGVLQSVGAEAERMSRLVSNLLLLTRSDNAELTLQRERLDLAELLNTLAEQMTPQAAAAGVVIETDLPAQLEVFGDQDRLLALFINLLDNAIAYAPNSGVTVTGKTSAGQVQVEVADTGPGIPQDDLPHIFERFYRVDTARSRQSGGSGLGLAIALEIAHAHGGDITVGSPPGGGTIMCVSLPASDGKLPASPGGLQRAA